MVMKVEVIGVGWGGGLKLKIGPVVKSLVDQIKLLSNLYRLFISDISSMRYNIRQTPIG